MSTNQKRPPVRAPLQEDCVLVQLGMKQAKLQVLDGLLSRKTESLSLSVPARFVGSLLVAEGMALKGSSNEMSRPWSLKDAM